MSNALNDSPEDLMSQYNEDGTLAEGESNDVPEDKNVKNDSQAGEEGADDSDDSTGDSSTGDTKSSDDTPAGDEQPSGQSKPEATKSDTEEQVPAEPVRDVITIKDEDGKEYPIDQLPADFTPESYPAMIEATRKQAEADRKYERDTEKYQSDLVAADEAKQAEAIESEKHNIQSSWDIEIEALHKSERLPSNTTERDERIRKVFQFMVDENDRRAKAGIFGRINSFEDALDKMELKQAREADAKGNAAEREANKKRSSLIGSSKPTTASKSADSYYRAGTGTDNIVYDALNEIQSE